MRNDRVFHQPPPAPEEIERALRAAHRARSAAVHAYLRRAASWIRWVFRADAIRLTVPVRTATHRGRDVNRLAALRLRQDRTASGVSNPQDGQERYLGAAADRTGLKRRVRYSNAH